MVFNLLVESCNGVVFTSAADCGLSKVVIARRQVLSRAIELLGIFGDTTGA